MRVVYFTHSLVSDWNNGNAHFLRGVVRELLARGHKVDVYEAVDAWSRTNLIREAGECAFAAFRAAFPELRPRVYTPEEPDFDGVLEGADLAIVHEWNHPCLVAAVGRARRRHGFRLLFHDTHHRAVTAPEQVEQADLRDYDGVVTFGSVIRDLYLERGWAQRAWTWHEAADTRLFHPRPAEREAELVWVGNWGDGERTEELHEFLLEPVRTLGVRGTARGVRYPDDARRALRRAGLHYGGWVANHDVPALFAAHRVTVHVPRRPYVEALPGIPTIRPFEALACGIPLVCAPWEDADGLFRPGRDYLVAENGREMREHLRSILADDELARSLSASGLETIRTRHTCAHRVDELLSIYAELEPRAAAA